MRAWPITYEICIICAYEAREKCFKVVAVIILIQGKRMLSLLNVCESCVE